MHPHKDRCFYTIYEIIGFFWPIRQPNGMFFVALCYYYNKYLRKVIIS